MGPFNTFEYPMDASSDDGYNDMWQSSRLSWYISEDFDETRLQSAFSDMGITEESDEGRLSRALQSWMPDYVITNIEPMEKPPIEPVYSGKLGKDRVKFTTPMQINRVPSAVKHKKRENKTFLSPRDNKLRRSQSDCKYKRYSNLKGTSHQVQPKTEEIRLTRATSDESISTHYSSLFDISSHEEEPEVHLVTPRSKRKGKQKQEKKYTLDIVKLQDAQRKEAAKLFHGLIRKQNVLHADLLGMHHDEFKSEVFDLLSPDDQKLILATAKRKGIRYTKHLTKSNSTTTLNEPQQLQRQKKLRVLSAGHKPLSKGFNIEEARQQIERERLAEMRKRQSSKISKGRRMSSRKSISARSELSSNISVVTPSMVLLSPSTTDTKPLNVWKGDKEILEMDLRRGLTGRVKKRIKTTTSALERVTGYGEHNSLHKMVGRCTDFPQFIDDDYGLRPKIVQKMRISPYLSNVIKEDIKVRMGRPRYHEIKIKDLEWWNRGQTLNRAHRNLKVFNWLHSLREDEFEHILEFELLDKPPESDNDIAIFHVEAADEPDIKPLYQTDFFK